MNDIDFMYTAGYFLRERFADADYMFSYITLCSWYGAIASAYDLSKFVVRSNVAQHPTFFYVRVYTEIYGVKPDKHIIVSTTLLTLFKQLSTDADTERPLAYLVAEQFRYEMQLVRRYDVDVSIEQMSTYLALRICSYHNRLHSNAKVFEYFEQFVAMAPGKTTMQKLNRLFPELELYKLMQDISKRGLDELELAVFTEATAQELTELVVYFDAWTECDMESPSKALAAFERLFEELITFTDNNYFVDLLSFTAYRLIDIMITTKQKFTFAAIKQLVLFCIGKEETLEVAFSQIYGGKYDKFLLNKPPRVLFSLADDVPKAQARFLRYFCDEANDSKSRFERIGNEILYSYFNRVNQQEFVRANGWIPYPPTAISVPDSGKGVIVERYCIQFEKNGTPLTDFIHCVAAQFMSMYGDSGVEDGIEEMILYGRYRKAQTLDLCFDEPQ